MLNIDLTGKTALITGGAMGIGRSCAIKLAEAGADIILADISPTTRKTQKEILRLGVGCQVFIGDLFEEKQIKRLVVQFSPDILVGCPYGTIRKPALGWNVSDYREVLDATLVSHLYLAGKVAVKMKSARTKGKIIFISSVYGVLNRANSIGYDIAKAGLNHGMRVLARELAPYHINVNAVAPGFTVTPGERKLESERGIKELSDKIPLGACDPDDIGNAVTFLSSNLASMITGQVLTVDGGYSLVGLE